MNERMREARRRLFYPVDDSNFYASLVGPVAVMGEPAKGLGEAFLHNLRAVVHTVSVPFVMVHESVVRRRFQALHTAEQIRARNHLDENGVVPEWAQEAATLTARERFAQEQASPEGGNSLADHILSELGDHLQSADFSSAAHELIRQGTVLTWGALEVLIKDAYTAVKGTGTPGPKAALVQLLSTSLDGRTLMEQRGIWVLFQRRHLIVHRRAVVDAEYVGQTGDSTPLGQELKITPDELECYLQKAIDTGLDVLHAVK